MLYSASSGFVVAIYSTRRLLVHAARLECERCALTSGGLFMLRGDYLVYRHLDGLFDKDRVVCRAVGPLAAYDNTCAIVAEDGVVVVVSVSGCDFTTTKFVVEGKVTRLALDGKSVRVNTTQGNMSVTI